uniref:Reverse transcriptase domain-containing protein n=1 Tax=Oryza sativa subsp. japonica TaxID=39947 RepID=Q6F2Y5_ORYSJ|nr:hypothetical protein [Oryza sativa Japonica Group]
MSKEASLEWLQKRVQEYRSTKNDIGKTTEDFAEVENLGKGFTSADPFEEVDIGDGTKPRPTFVNKNMRADYKVKIIELLKEYVDCFAWEYHEMPGLSRELVEHRLSIKPADMMINDASGHKVISFLDGNAGYNQIFMAEEDMYKMVFRCPGFVDLFEWVVMTFGLKNACATYQRAMNLIFHDLLAFERMRQNGLKMNPLKCAFGVSAGKFLGFMVHERGVEIDPKKIEKICDFKAPTCKPILSGRIGK